MFEEKPNGHVLLLIVRLRTNVRRKLNGRGLVVGREETKE
jgi:hypothetical protein